MRQVSLVLFLWLDRGTGNRRAGGFKSVNDLCGGRADTVQRGFQLRQLLVAAPAGDIYRAVADASDPKDVMAVQFWLEYIAEKRSCLLGLSQKAHMDFCEVFISWKWPAKQFNYEDASMNNYFYLVKVIPYFLARSIDSMERADYLLRMRNPILKDFISDLNKEIKRIETIGLFDSVEPLRPLSQVINNYRPIFLNS